MSNYRKIYREYKFEKITTDQNLMSHNISTWKESIVPAFYLHGPISNQLLTLHFNLIHLIIKTLKTPPKKEEMVYRLFRWYSNQGNSANTQKENKRQTGSS